MKVVFVIGDPKKNLLARLTSMFTQCPAYHVGFLDEETNMFYDMYWLRRRRKWPRYDDNKCVMFDAPEVTREFLEEKLKNLEKEFEGREIPRPQNWGGYLAKPYEIEFWQGRPNRLHDRILYELQEDYDWKISRLAP